ncbi:hypothetical protein ARAM_003297 [Aspergillus rambellii]|uniref:HMA domain-containing protein n=1 Tax=Aspergillus rambellii TaxID=308745 RepID=A0A0F8UZN0_9EURO|nr:hypothetical protein ARAM_003297 [Aspergillus rambellii]
MAQVSHAIELSSRSTFFVSNVHCSSCVAFITHVLSEIPGLSDIEVSIFTHEVHVVHTQETDPISIARILIQAAFEVHHVTTTDATGVVVSDCDTEIVFHGAFPDTSPRHSRTRHLANCDACRKEEQQQSPAGLHVDLPVPPPAPQKSFLSPRGSESGAHELMPPKNVETQFKAHLSIAGMSCASCVNSITDAVKELDFVDEITVTLLSNSASVVYHSLRSKIDDVIERIEDIGFEASLDEVNPINASDPPHTQRHSTYIADIAIGGMTCGACSGAVTQGLRDLSWVTNVTVNLLSHSAQVEFEDPNKLPLIVEKIEDLGYDASIVKVTPPKVVAGKRTVSVRVDGMFCHHCPEKVYHVLRELPGLEVDETLSVKNPILKATYTPTASPSTTVRSIVEKIGSAHSGFQASVYHPPSVEDRSRAMQIHERRRLLSRFLFVLLAAIPSFLLGIVFMSLVPADNHIRQYLEQPMWSGSVSRMEWALWMMTTPVMFYGADIFHVRAAKEIRSLWRRGSRVPILRRFYRFGSMSLLISAGTLVAYISSLGILVADAVARNHSNPHSTTYFDSVVFLTLFILAGRFLEAYSKARAGDAVASLGKLRPSEALLVVHDGCSSEHQSDRIQRIHVDLLEIGDRVRVPHGASPPADGKIAGPGLYQFDESSLTGESNPVSKSIGDQVYTGSVNVGQPVEFEITAVGGSSMLDQIIAVVREGQSRRAPLERVADVLVAHFVPVITLIAILTFVIWVSLGVSGALPPDYLDANRRGGWTFWSLEFAIAVFVVACPCGLALAAPTALFVGGGLAARYGILVKGGGEAFQEASRLNAIVFDKTGTLTEGGSLQVSDHETFITDPQQRQIAWVLARHLEESSNHPIARAIAEFCKNTTDKEASHAQGLLPSITSSEIQEESGQGMHGRFVLSTTHHYEAAIGNQRFLESLSATTTTNNYYLSSTLSQYQSAGKSTAILCMRQIPPPSPAEGNPPLPRLTPTIAFAVSDSIRPHAATVISKLHERKISVYMCTGDNETTAHAVADRLGIPRSHVLANVLPAGKADFVRSIQHPPSSSTETQPEPTRQIVAFVGDGINDSPALSTADVSIALASGSDVALHSASFILLNSSLETILQLTRLSRRVVTRVRMNFCWAVLYNLALVPVAAGVFYPLVTGQRSVLVGGEMVAVREHWRLSPVWAALAMALSSVSVVCSSLALVVDGEMLTRVRGVVS